MCFFLKWPISCASTASSSGPVSWLNQRVRQHDFPKPSEAGEDASNAANVCCRPSTGRFGRGIGCASPGQHPFAQAAFRQRREFVEQRQNQNRREHAHQELKCQHRAPGPQPPPCPVAWTIFKMSTSSGYPSARASRKPFNRSDHQIFGVVVLNPIFCSSRNCAYQSNGQPGSDTANPAANRNAAIAHADEPDPWRKDETPTAKHR